AEPRRSDGVLDLEAVGHQDQQEVPGEHELLATVGAKTRRPGAFWICTVRAKTTRPGAFWICAGPSCFRDRYRYNDFSCPQVRARVGTAPQPALKNATLDTPGSPVGLVRGVVLVCL